MSPRESTASPWGEMDWPGSSPAGRWPSLASISPWRWRDSTIRRNSSRRGRVAEQAAVVITGSGGRIGALLRRALAGKYRLRGIDRVPTPGVPGALVASLTDLDAILPVFTGADAVVHLAADPRHTPDIGWDTLIPDNVVATANVYEAARQGGVKRFVFFSSMR